MTKALANKNWLAGLVGGAVAVDCKLLRFGWLISIQSKEWGMHICCAIWHVESWTRRTELKADCIKFGKLISSLYSVDRLCSPVAQVEEKMSCLDLV